MLSENWRAGLLAGALGLLAAVRAEAQLAPQPPGFPPAEARAGEPAQPVTEVPATGFPMKCVPDFATRKVDKRVYSSACFNMCYPKCGHGGCGGCGGPCDAEACHKCSHVYTHKYLVLHICPKEYRVNTCKPVPATCEGPCPPAPCEMPVPGAYAAPGVQAVPMAPPYLAVPPGR